MNTPSKPPSGLVAFTIVWLGQLVSLLAGVLLSFIGIRGVLAIDIVTFLFALGALLLVHILQPLKTDDWQSDQNHLL